LILILVSQKCSSTSIAGREILELIKSDLHIHLSVYNVLITG
jgi:hypothetical protein